MANYIDIIFLLDESFSMHQFCDKYIEVINSFINAQKQLHPTSNLTFIKFNTTVKTLCINSNITTIPEFTTKHYDPDGITSLYDAIGYAINLKYNNIQKNKAIMFILTDGHDNNSSKYNILGINNQIKYLKTFGWDFVYIATGQNAFDFGKRIGIDEDKCILYSESNNSIPKIANACNIALSCYIKKISGYDDVYSNMELQTDLTDLINGMDKILI